MVPESCIVQCSRETKTSSFECPSEEVTLIQCDASQSGPGSVTVHNRKSVVYAQILKELFVVVLASDHFDAYISIMSALVAEKWKNTVWACEAMCKGSHGGRLAHCVS